LAEELMADQNATDPDRTTIPNRASNKEPAEGSRETVEASEERAEGGGISNRPDSEERQGQDNLPPRGKAKGGSHA
jgi:hypothetical protein